ncbi:hypothetical protein GCM10027514_29260 [Azotobacter armeniacus]
MTAVPRAVLRPLADSPPSAIVALALFGSIGSGLSSAMAEPREREAALVTLMITASGLTLLSIDSVFWGLLGGLLTLAILEWRRSA